MMTLSGLGIPLGFAYPLALIGLLSLPIIWWLLHLTPPKPMQEVFPPTKVLEELLEKEETPAQSPWWLTLLRLLMAALIIFALAQTIWNPRETTLARNGNLLLIMENGWASSKHWEARTNSAKTLLEEAANAERNVIVINSISTSDEPAQLTPAGQLLSEISGWKAYPLRPDYGALALKVEEAVSQYDPQSIVFLSDAITHLANDRLVSTLAKTPAELAIYLPVDENPAALNGVRNDPDALVGDIIRLGEQAASLEIVGYDIKGLPVTRRLIQLDEGQKNAAFKFDVPVELRNEIVRVAIEDQESAGAIQLMDESNRRRLVGLISGEKHDASQPLLSPLYYISRALEPFSDIRRASSANVSDAVPDLIAQGVSAIILADVGVIPDETKQTLTQWMEKGGLIARFAGPRLASTSNNELLPVRLRQGDRNIGGALSWEEPKPVAPFEVGSPFFGLDVPEDVAVKRQVLALQETNLEEKTWAQLSDGTPLVTASRQNAGWLVLFHVGSDAAWSNLPLSGTFVDMLRRIINQSRSSGVGLTQGDTQSLPPYRLLNAKGYFEPPQLNAKPATFNPSIVTKTDPEHFPGLYGTVEGFRALNLFNGDAKLEPLDPGIFINADIRRYANAQQLSLKPWLFAAAAFLFVLDCLAVLWMGGAFARFTTSGKRLAANSVLWALLAFFFVTNTQSVYAQSSNADQNNTTNEQLDFSAALETRLAYVRTGIAEVDEITEAGLFGLSQFLTSRTAIEPGAPMALDISRDELAFYPLIYWPIHTASPIPDQKTMARVDAFMKQGGSILFDTRDQLSSLGGGTSSSPEALHLQTILQSLDIPPLEPVPSDHVLTKSFFILESFPGRYQGGDLWVEQTNTQKQRENRPVRGGDGVSSIMITSNDLAGAWAIDSQLRPLLPTVPPDPLQREYAFRVGVNLAMYTMTGNYKADQVHIPALLERLGQ